MPPHRAVRSVAEALPLNEGPEEQVEDLLDVLCAQPAPAIHQQQTKHVQGEVSQSCLRVCQEEEEGQMKKPTWRLSKPGGKHHPKLTLFPNSLLDALLPSLTPCATQMTGCSTASLGSLPSQAPAPIALFHFHFHPSSPNLPTKGRTRPERGCSELSVPSQLSRGIIPQSTHGDGSVPKTGEKEGSDCSQEKGTLLRTIFLVFTNTFPSSNVQFSRRKTPVGVCRLPSCGRSSSQQEDGRTTTG